MDVNALALLFYKYTEILHAAAIYLFEIHIDESVLYGIILSLTVSKVKMPFEPSVLQALRAFLFRFETKKIVFYFPLLCFCIVLI